MWVFIREILDDLKLTSGGMPFSYSQRLGEAKLNHWRDGFRNLLFLFAKRFGIPMTHP